MYDPYERFAFCEGDRITFVWKEYDDPEGDFSFDSVSRNEYNRVLQEVDVFIKKLRNGAKTFY
ncbi:hypothetical protein [Prosthecobacter sp.]|uniref:hypothetical protein n=1 Tax=Prosthecobacter sp. TaxID=1965333 RepID=UPI0037840065